MMPAGLFYQIPHPIGVLPYDPVRRGQFHVLADAAALSPMPAAERSAVARSAAKTYTRGVYHESRFFTLRTQLDERRYGMPGEIIFDSLLEYVHFELQSFAGACRTLVDELVYIIARRQGVPPAGARRFPWTAADLFGATPRTPPPTQNAPEVSSLLALKDWFETLNAYRNTFFHSGWSHGSGHFSSDDLRRRAQYASSNGLLVPDRTSLSGKSKPHEWTWHERATVDDIASAIRTGAEDLLDRLLGGHWGTPIPPSGTVPLSEKPNIIVGLAHPALLYSDLAAFVPLFSTRELAESFSPFSTNPKLELVDIPSSKLVTGEQAFTFAFPGIENMVLPRGITHVEILLDPLPDTNWQKIGASAHVRLDIAELGKMGSINPVSWPASGVERVWLWRAAEQLRLQP
jgi:hypothetical protein